VTKIYNVGSRVGFGPVDARAEQPAFSSDWEAHALALGVLLVRSGVLDDVGFAAPPLELPGDQDGAAPYESFFDALCCALGNAGVLDDTDLAVVAHGGR
jgi:hypothetical protein